MHLAYVNFKRSGCLVGILLLLSFTFAFGTVEDFNWDDKETLSSSFNKEFPEITLSEEQTMPIAFSEEDSPDFSNTQFSNNKEDSVSKPIEPSAEAISENVSAQPPDTKVTPMAAEESQDKKPEKQATEEKKERVIQPGDKIVYRVIEDRDPQITIPVLESGEIIIPYYGPIEAAGLTPSKLTERITKLLKEELYQKATVLLAVQTPAPSSFIGTVYLSGRVNRIGPMQIDPNQKNTVSKLILSAGGFSDFADKSAVQIIRQVPGSNETEIIEVDVESVLEEGQLDKDVRIQDGDYVIIKQRLFNW